MLLFLVVMVLSSCNANEEWRSMEEASFIAMTNPDLDVVHFVVSANCDYDYFFEYMPMRYGGFYAYGYQDEQPLLLIIPKYEVDDPLLITWPLHFSIRDVIGTLNDVYDEEILSLDIMYDHVRIELTSDVLNVDYFVAYDFAFFIVVTIDDSTYVAFQQDNKVVIYNEEDGFRTPN